WVALFFVIAAVGLQSCEKEGDDIGVGFQENGLLLNQTDTLTLTVNTITEPILRSDELSVNMIGNYLDPLLGVTKTSFATQLRISTVEQDFGANPVVDSLVLAMEYDGFFYGKNKPQIYSVKELDEDLFLDTVYYSNADFAVKSPELVAPGKGYLKFELDDFVRLANGDSLPPQLRLRLTDELGQQLINLGTSAYVDNESFLQAFKGIRVESLTDDGGVIPLDLLSGNSKLTLHYHNESDTLDYDYTINTQSARVELFDHDFAGPTLALEDGEMVDASIEGYVQAASSTKLKIEIPHLDDFRDSEDVIINRAELIIPEDESYDGRFPRQSLLFVLTENEDGEFVGLPDQLSSLVNIGGSYNSAEGAYVFNISKFVQQYLTGIAPSSNLYLVSNSASVSVNRVVINGPESSSDNKMRLILTYSR
ncbi:MAG: DUF4270 family protein, partial [Flavobacteriales bacterium]|nr:DUF4270 family protein [Flavobacteriales bacterium]